MDPDTKLKLDTIQRSNNYPGYERLVKLAQEKYPEISRSEVKTFLSHDTARQLTTVQHAKKAEGHIVAMLPNELWQMDIFDLSRYMYSNKYFRYLLCCVDVFTRKVYVEALKEKDSEACAKAFEKIVKSNGVKPRSILSDHDAAFLREPFQKILTKEGIALNLNALNDHHALGIIDNFARRFKMILTTTFLKNHTTKWLDRYQNIITIYNNTKHSSLKDKTPNEATKPGNHEEILKLNLEKQVANKTVSDLEVDDKVRKNLLTRAHQIMKGTDPRWSDEVFIVKQIHGNTVILNDGSRMKRTDLLKVPPGTQSSERNVIAIEKKAYKEYKNK